MPQRAIRYGRRAPGQLTILLAALVLLCLATGLTGVLDIAHRRAVLTGIAERGGQLTGAAQEIYQSLSDADATAASAFLVGGVEPDNLRRRYQQSISTAATAISTAAAGSPTGTSAVTVTDLSAYLPVYTGLIETARTLNRQGLPQGIPYLREASGLMQRTMLPKAKELFQSETARLARDEADAGGFGWFPIALGILALAGLVAAQIYLSRSTNRVFNAGLLAATLAVLLALGWYAIGSSTAANRASASQTGGTAQIEALAVTRIGALTARSDEALTLVARGNGAEYEQDFGRTSELLEGKGGGLFAGASAAVSQDETRKEIEAAVEAWQNWKASHKMLRDLDNAGKFNEAVQFATVDPRGTQPPSTQVDAHLGTAIKHATDRFTAGTGGARAALSSVDAAVAGLTVLAVLGLIFGFAPRLREFR